MNYFHFILINNNKKILPTLLSRCIDFKISLSNQQILDVSNVLLGKNLYETINQDLLNYYLTPGNIYNLVNFGKNYDIDLVNLNLSVNLLKSIHNIEYKELNCIQGHDSFLVDIPTFANDIKAFISRL